MNMKTWAEFILENKDNSETGINPDIIKLSSYILDFMKNGRLRHYIFHIKDLIEDFPFLKTWTYDAISVRINSSYMNKTIYLKFSNSVGIFLKAFSKSTLNHELMHVLQSLTDKDVLLIDYENQSVLTHIRGFFRKNADNIELLKGLFYIADSREMEAFVHSFRKMRKDEKVELLSYVLLLKYFNLKNLIEDKNLLRQFITIWMKYYNDTDIPYFDRVRLRSDIRRNRIDIDKEEIDNFTKEINDNFHKIGTIYMRKLNNQFLDNDVDAERFVKYLNLAKLNIVRNDFKYVIDLSKAKDINLSSDTNYDVTTDWE